MQVLLKIFVLSALVLGVYNTEVEESSDSSSLLPELDYWWGPEELKCNYDTSVRPFEIKFSDEMICDLKARMKNHRTFTPPLEGAAFEYGFNSDQMAHWLDYWANSYNFTEREAYLNQYPHYKMYVQGLDMHFMWIKPEVSSDVKVLPLMMLHGWPGSVREFYKAIPLISQYAEENGFAVEIIVPSLPGFGFSSGAVRPHCGAAEMAVILRNLMHGLGHEKYYLQGGDWGAHICNLIVTQFPDEVLGYHTNYAVSLSPATFATWIMGAFSSAMQSLVVKSSVADRLYPLLTILKGLMTETGYMHIQATKPDTVGLAVSESPSGLLAYILQIVSMASRSDFKYMDDGGILSLYSYEEMLDNLMIYWSNNAFVTAIRIYAETYNMRNVEMGLFAKPTSVPLCTIHAKDELIFQPHQMLQYKFTNLLNSTILDTGGHFLALELPEVFAESVVSALVTFRDWHAEQQAMSHGCSNEL